MRKHNFSGGPGELPASVLSEAARAVEEMPGTGLSILGLSHRSRLFREMLDEAEENLRRLVGIPKHYRVLFLQGGGSLQFAMIPMHLLRGRERPAEYLQTGYWSARSIPDAQLEGPVSVVWSGEHEGYRRLPRRGEIRHDPSASYVHYVSNETVEGLQHRQKPGAPGVPAVVDLSSDFLSRPHRVEDYVILYAHAQKNLGPAGVTVVIVRDDVVREGPRDLPAMLQYRNHSDAGSIYNTPPVFAIYTTLLVTRWLRDEVGSLEAMASINAEKARIVYAALDKASDVYLPHAEKADRSPMNVAFRLASPSLELAFLEEAEREGLCGLEGHRSIGGLRASLYNAVSVASAQALASFLDAFASRVRERGSRESVSLSA